MLSHLKRHPFPVVAHFDFSLVLSYAFPQSLLQPLLPPHLELDTFNNWGFVTIAMVQTRGLRPAGFPAWSGQDFFLIGYRLFVKYHSKGGKRLRGLYILKSETNRTFMKTIGNIFTYYNYVTTDIDWKKEDYSIAVCSRKSDLNIQVSWNKDSIALPEDSIFSSWKEARRFAGPLPFTFDYESDSQSMTIIEGVRENWVPLPVSVQTARIGLLDQSPFSHFGSRLANAFVIQHIPYRWEKGQSECLL